MLFPAFYRIKPSPESRQQWAGKQHYNSGSGRNRHGAALVIILAFVVLLTGLIVAFFSRAMSERQVSNSSANQSKVELLAQGAIDSITGDLKQEIAAGSMSITGTVGAATFVPTSPGTVVPALALTGTTSISGTSFAPNLLKRSAYGQPLYSGTNYNLSNNTVATSGTSTVSYAVPNRAINASTSGTSQNGRFISSARWNKPLLLPRQNEANTTDFTPIASGTNAFVPPDWILVAQDGSNPATWSGSLAVSGTIGTGVIGRYAYVIYDEGGLLDVNVAGCPSGMTTLSQYGDKGSLALADLMQLTDSAGNPVLTQAQIDAIVGWRNYSTVQPPGTFPNFGITGTNAALNFYNFISTTTKGFIAASGTALFNNQSDRIFTSRQQLIKFLAVTGTLGGNTLAATQNALQYLSTFSRDLEQPYFVPDPNLSNPVLLSDTNARRSKNLKFPIDSSANGSDSYDPTGASQDLINPSLLTVHDSNGQPVMKRRFPLGRLLLLDQAGQTLRSGGALSASQTNQIYDYFGLTWDPANARWNYNHGDPTRIYRLSEISAGNNPDGTLREPDFFETLKAAINCDSLGKQHGGLDNSSTPRGSNGSLIDGMIHNQMIQIGANLIDQYDADGYPTCIFFNSREFYGVENLPFLAGWQQMWYRMKPLVVGADINPTIGTPPTAADGTVYETNVMIQPIIWNPHSPDTNTNPSAQPTSFRVVAGSLTDTAVTLPFYPQVKVAWWTTTTTGVYPATATYAAANAMTLSGSLYSYPKAIIDPAASILTFNSGTGSGYADFREPYRLCAPDSPANSHASNDPGYAAGRITVGADHALAAIDGSTVIGISCGKCWTGPSIDHANTQKWLSSGNVNRDFKLRLQYKDSSGVWRTYDVIDDVYNASGNLSTVDNADTVPYLRGFRTCVRTDPRTNRWGLYQMNTFPSTDPASVPAGVAAVPVGSGVTSNGPFSNGVDPQGTPLYYLPQGITWKPSASSSYLMTGNNAGGAPAPGWIIINAPSAPNVGDLMVNYRSTAANKPNPNMGTSGTASPGGKNFYTDVDGVMRRASGWNFSGNDGLPNYTNNMNSRPVVLNRPFRSVAEMAYASRGMAWKEVDFFTPESGDAALLDVFCLNELDNAPTDVSVAGRVNLNTRQPKVLQALISGVSKAEGGILTSTEAANAAQALVKWTADTTTKTSGVLTKGPLRNRSELVGKFVYQVPFNPVIGGLSGGQTPVLDGNKSYSGFSSMLTAQPVGIFASAADAAIKRRCECVMRSLADCGNTRTWNLMVDLIAQVGRYPSNATGPDKFLVEGETRYWVHLAIDRYTGTVVAKLVEPVSE